MKDTSKAKIGTERHVRAGKLGLEASRAAREKRLVDIRAAYYANPRLCQNCKEPLSFEKKQYNCCSQSCASVIRNTGTRRYGLPPGNCKLCGVKLESHARQYCSMRCHRRWEWNEVIAQVQVTGIYPSDVAAKRHLLQIHGHKCCICGLAEWCGRPIPIVLDHIDGHADNRSVDNVRLLCCNCDAQTPTYKAKNKGNGRFKRRQRYAEGKSY